MSSTDLRIGGTRASSILGVGFQTPYEVWAEMTGKVEKPDIGHLEHIEAGNFLEDGAAKWFAHRTGLKVLDCPGLLVDHDFPWLSGTPDRAIINLDGTPGLLSCKNTGNHARAQWSDGDDGEIPLGYQVQESVYLRITGYEIVHYAAIIGGQKLRTPQMRRNDAFIAAMLEELQRFMHEHVQKDIPPPVSGDDLDALKRMFPKESGRIVTAGANSPATVALNRLIELKRQIKALSAERDSAEAIVKAAMQDAVELVTPDARCTWKYQRAEHKARPAQVVESRVLRTKE